MTDSQKSNSPLGICDCQFLDTQIVYFPYLNPEFCFVIQHNFYFGTAGLVQICTLNTTSSLVVIDDKL